MCAGGRNQHLEVGVARVEQLVRFARRMEEDVARFHRMTFLADTHEAVTGAHEEQLPLRVMHMEGADRLARRDAAELQVERMAAAPGAGIEHAAERRGEVADEGVKMPGGRKLLDLGDIQDAGARHGAAYRKSRGSHSHKRGHPASPAVRPA